MTTEAVSDHVELALDFIGRSRVYLKDGDLHQACEKGWGAASHIIKAVAAHNNWEYESHEQFTNVVMNARQRYRRFDLLGMADAAQALHVSYYQRKKFISEDAVRGRIGEVEKMVDFFKPHLS